MYLSQNSNIHLAVGYSQLAIGYWRSLTYIYPFQAKYPSEGEKLKFYMYLSQKSNIHLAVGYSQLAIGYWRSLTYKYPF
jgi:hypothetical protein